MENLIISIIKSIENSNNKKTRRKLKVIKSFLGISRLMQPRIDELNRLLKQENIETEPFLRTGISDETNITFKFFDSTDTNSVTNRIESDNFGNNKISGNISKPSLIIGDDFFRHLFDFENSQEYERFQASLDSNSPIALFIIPKKENFYSGIVDRILSFEVIRKRQYQGKGSTVGNISSRNIIKKSEDIFEGILSEDNGVNFWTGCDIHSFNNEVMDEIILGDFSQNFKHLKDFNNRLNQLALYSNKYYSNDQFFVVFNCPSIHLISQERKTPTLDNLVEKVTLSLPNTFKLICRYGSDEELIQDELIRNHIINHFKILFEIPFYNKINTDSNILNVFSDFQKAQNQFESQLIHNIDPVIFSQLNWGYESEEHVFLKYFAIKTLHKYYGYSIDEIVSEKSETFTDENINIDYNSRPDVKAENLALGSIIVEAETMRGKSYLNMIGEIVQ